MRAIIFFWFALSPVFLPGQAISAEEVRLNGFEKKIAGEDYKYHSSIPFVRECLIARATDGTSAVEWETAPVPVHKEGDLVAFTWIAGIGSSPGDAPFDVHVDGEKKFTFWTNGKSAWKIDADDGYALAFDHDMVDRAGDHFGFMTLTVAGAEVEAGSPLRITVTGRAFQKSSWYMTFTHPVENTLDFKTYPAIFSGGGKEEQLGIVRMLYTGGATAAKLYVDGRLTSEMPVQFGYNHLRMGLPAAQSEKEIGWKFVAGDYREEGTVAIRPARNWRINFVQHTHTDIGYTRSQTEILGEHLRFIDYALDYCDMTDDYPDDAKFRWTCEATWPVNEFLQSRPEAQIERLRKRVEEGRIEIAGMYFNFDELPDEQTLAASLQPLKRIKAAGLDVKMAMQNDVNGIGWCLNDYYSDLGIEYLNMGTHGHKALICFDKPTLFWWESPSGNRMLAYRAEHYMTGNFFELHKQDFNVFEERLLSYLQDLEDKGYEYDLTSIQFSGYFTDNSPPSTRASDMIRQWNEKYAWPKLKTATATEFFEEMERAHGDEFQTIRGAWPDWWTDGFGASAREVETTRRAQTDLLAGMAGLTMAGILGSDLPENMDDRLYWTKDALLFYTEHTVGYHASVREPFHKYTMEQRALKESYAWEGGRRAKLIGEEALGLLQGHFTRESQPSVVVFNSLNWSRSGLVNVYMDHQLVPHDKQFRIVDEDGQSALAQAIETHGDGTYWALWVQDVPAFGYKKYVIELGDHIRQPVNKTEQVDRLENQWYNIQIDHQRGAITSIYDKQLAKELVDQDAEYQLGEFIYETLGRRGQLDAFHLEDYARVPLEKVWYERYEEGDIWNTVYFKGTTEAAIGEGTYEFEIRLFNQVKRIDLAYAILKKSVTDPEGIYIAFPFALDKGVLSFDVQGGEIRAGVDQIPGSSNDWNTVQNYARLANGRGQILLSSQEMPLMQFGGINLGRFESGATPASGHIYGWPMNNYWVTNFNAEQRGGIDWVYSISSAEDASQQYATRYGWGNRVPFLCRVFPGGGAGDVVWTQSVIEGWPDNIILVDASPSQGESSCTLQVREVNGEKADLGALRMYDSRPLRIREVNVLKEEVGHGSAVLQPYETKFLKLDW